MNKLLKRISSFEYWIMLPSVAIALFYLLKAMVIASHWPLVHDEPIMHYVVFLTSHGLAPYKDIIDMQMPGSYITDELVIHILGPGSGAEIIWDFLNCVITVLAAAWITGPKRRAAGLIAGCLTCMWHLKDGAWCLGERDWVVTALLFLSVACLLQSIRKNQSAWVGLAFLCAGLAASIKPPALLIPLACFGVILVRVAPRASFIKGSVFWSVLGLLVPMSIVAAYILSFNVMHEFIKSMTSLTPYYASLQRLSVKTLISSVTILIQLGIIAAAMFFAKKSWRSTESSLLLVAAACGGLLYLIQGKGFSYHAYVFAGFVMLWMMYELSDENRTLTLWSFSQSIALALLVLWMARLSLSIEKVTPYPTGTVDSLERDLRSLNVKELSGHVQCLDMTLGGCLDVLYRLRLVQSTGYISDFYLFPRQPTPLTDEYQKRFYQSVTENPPAVFILSSHTWPGDSFGYSKVSNFPLLQQLLENRYKVRNEHFKGSNSLAGYKLYVRK
jgi:hypothetical protein